LFLILINQRKIKWSNYYHKVHYLFEKLKKHVICIKKKTFKICLNSWTKKKNKKNTALNIIIMISKEKHFAFYLSYQSVEN
jgi:hypothetical protein